MGTPQPQITDLLRINQPTYEKLVRMIDAHATCGTAARQRRQHERLRYTPKSPVITVLDPESGGPLDDVYIMRPVDISVTGVGLLHGCFVYPGTRCCVLLKDLDGGIVQAAGTVVFSRLVTGKTHNLGVRFDEPIETERFVDSTETLDQARGDSVWNHGWTDLVDAPMKDIQYLIRSLQRESNRNDAKKTGRRTERFDFQEGAILAVMNPTDPDARQVYRVVPIDISSSGTGFVHGSFVYPGMSCDVMMLTVEGQTEQIDGIVSQCRHLQAKLHAIGVKFNRQIDVSRFVVIEDPLQESAEDGGAEDDQRTWHND